MAAPTPPPRIRVEDSALMEITRRATTRDELAQSWAQYLLLLDIVSKVLDHAPQDAMDCAALDVVERLGDDMEAIAGLLHHVFPGGLKEAWYYLPKRRA